MVGLRRRHGGSRRQRHARRTGGRGGLPGAEFRRRFEGQREYRSVAGTEGPTRFQRAGSPGRDCVPPEQGGLQRVARSAEGERRGPAEGGSQEGEDGILRIPRKAAKNRKERQENYARLLGGLCGTLRLCEKSLLISPVPGRRLAFGPRFPSLCSPRALQT